jgi:RNA recognition motif-containing protein
VYLLMDNKDGRPKGSGFVEFETQEGLVKALELHDTVRPSC